ncbi:MAG TPA: NAD-dependent epimerase/dehydratase family protein [Candidatus Methylacidiphilales bacterium]|nr:NAD-dependent epimerase/dehydratase family protein [Candidatus Methylacidiphilales bacterium]
MKGTTFISGAAGFIGSNLADRLLAAGDAVVGYDNFSTGREEFLASASRQPDFRLVRGDVLDEKALTAAMKGCNRVIHLAANADVRFGLEHPRRDLEQNTLGTFQVLEAMRACGIRDLGFASTGSIYGEATIIPTPEDAPMPVQTSLYGASKLAGEALIAAYAEGFGFRARIFRFVSILGPRYTHGHVFDFCRKLGQNPEILQVLGDGTARKSYLAVEDCVEAMLTVFAHPPKKEESRTGGFTQIYNLGTDDYCKVSDSVQWICAALGLKPEVHYTGGDRGWIGDNPFIFLDTKKIRSLGWKPRLTIREGVEATVAWLKANPWFLSCR